MAKKPFKIKLGVNIEPTTTAPTQKGDVSYDSATDKFVGYNGAAY